MSQMGVVSQVLSGDLFIARIQSEEWHGLDEIDVVTSLLHQTVHRYESHIEEMSEPWGNHYLGMVWWFVLGVHVGTVCTFVEIFSKA